MSGSCEFRMVDSNLKKMCVMIPEWVCRERIDLIIQRWSILFLWVRRNNDVSHNTMVTHAKTDPIDGEPFLRRFIDGNSISCPFQLSDSKKERIQIEQTHIKSIYLIWYRRNFQTTQHRIHLKYANYTHIYRRQTSRQRTVGETGACTEPTWKRTSRNITSEGEKRSGTVEARVSICLIARPLTSWFCERLINIVPF